MAWGQALNKAIQAAGVPSTFTKWRDLAANRDQWRVLCGAKARGTVHTAPKHPRDIWAQVADGLPPSNTAHPATAPTATHPGSDPRAQRHSEVVGCLNGRPRFRQSQGRGEECTRGRPRPLQS